MAGRAEVSPPGRTGAWRCQDPLSPWKRRTPKAQLGTSDARLVAAPHLVGQDLSLPGVAARLVIVVGMRTGQHWSPLLAVVPGFLGVSLRRNVCREVAVREHSRALR
jgi:hypothetical protein